MDDSYQLPDWPRILLGDLPGQFLFEVLFRTLIMFVIVFASIRATGKTTVRQLSVLDLVLIIGLGSAAGDPMFYHDVGLLPAFLVFGIIVLIYAGLLKLSAASPRAAAWVQGKAVLLIEDGQFALDNFRKEQLGKDEFFMELREGGIEHLGQVRRAYLESSGNISLFCYEDEAVRFGLPILPELFERTYRQADHSGPFACSFCGYVTTPTPDVSDHRCPRCQHTEWVKAIDSRRVT
jgi:uncharacterized membrane protein YcaP (DUF421 family)